MFRSRNKHRVRGEAMRRDDSMLLRLFLRMLPVQILIVAMGSVNSIVDGVTTARCIGAASVGIIGLYYTMVEVMEAVSAVLAGGAGVMCGRYLGGGKLKETDGVFALNITLALIFGVVLTAASFIAASPIARALGAGPDLQKDLATYIIWYAFGIIPQLIAHQLAGFLQLERQGRRCYIGAAAMIITNVLMDILLVAVLRKGVMGLALATAIANWVYFLILAPYYLKGKAQLKFIFPKAWRQEAWEMVRIGFPGASLVFCIAARTIAVNRILLKYAGSDGLSAVSSFNNVCGIMLAVALGAGAVMRMLTSVFVGEKDPDSVKALFRIMYKAVMPMVIAAAAVIFFASPLLAGIYYPDRGSEVYKLTRNLFAIYALCLPMVLVCQTSANYYQAIGKQAFVNFLSVFDGFVAMVVPALLLAPSLGAMGVWLANPIGIAATAALGIIYSAMCNKKVPKTLDEWLMLPQVFPEVEKYSRFSHSLHAPEEVAEVAERIQLFSEGCGMDKRTSFHSALCFEEMARNIFQHGFKADKKEHTVDLCMLIDEEEAMLRIKDDCVNFDPVTFVEMTSGESVPGNIGIRLVFKMASEVNYQNLIGLNVLTIKTARG